MIIILKPIQSSLPKARLLVGGPGGRKLGYFHFLFPPYPSFLSPKLGQFSEPKGITQPLNTFLAENIYMDLLSCLEVWGVSLRNKVVSAAPGNVSSLGAPIILQIPACDSDFRSSSSSSLLCQRWECRSLGGGGTGMSHSHSQVCS